MKAKEKEIAIKLRKKGCTYKEILNNINVSKGTLSLWLRDVQVPKDYFKKIKNIRERTLEKCAETVRNKWRKKYNKIYEEYKPLYNDPFYMLGLGIYMGEGFKYSRSESGLANSDLNIMLIYKKWVEKYFAEKNLRWNGCAHIYDETKSDFIIKWWAQNLNVPEDQISKPVTSVSSSSKRKRRTLKKGTFRLRAGGKNSWKITIKIKKAMDFAPVV